MYKFWVVMYWCDDVTAMNGEYLAINKTVFTDKEAAFERYDKTKVNKKINTVELVEIRENGKPVRVERKVR
jgi:hypothetical protein